MTEEKIEVLQRVSKLIDEICLELNLLQSFSGDSAQINKSLKNEFCLEDMSGSRYCFVSVKFQKNAGSAEWKTLHDVILLLKKVGEGSSRNILILGGNGWSGNLLNFIKDELTTWIPKAVDQVEIIHETELHTLKPRLRNIFSGD